MTRAALVARGFVPNLNLGTIFAFCRTCRTRRPHRLYAAPNRLVSVHCCQDCGTVPSDERGRVELYPVLDACESCGDPLDRVGTHLANCGGCFGGRL